MALALYMLPVADGSDMMGSLRNPAAWNNVFGFRPSYGRVPFGPTPEIFVQQLGYEGPMGRTVADLAMLLSVQAGFDARTPLSIDQDPAQFAKPLKRDFKGARIGWLGDFNGYLPIEPGVMDLCTQALQYFETIGCTVEVATARLSNGKALVHLAHHAWLPDRRHRRRPLYADPKLRAMMKPEAVWEIENGLKLSGVDVFRASADRSAWYQALRQPLHPLRLPGAAFSPGLPLRRQADWPKCVNGKPMDTYHRWMEVVIAGTLGGVPVLDVPAGFGANGLPMGLQILGPAQADLAVLQLAHSWEDASGYTKRRSSTCWS